MHNYPPITDRKIHLALAGCGRISANHFDAIEKHADRVKLVDVCDVNAAALEQAVVRTKARDHHSLTEMPKTTSADMVILTIPSGLHPEQAIQGAQSGRHVMAYTATLARDIEVEDSGVAVVRWRSGALGTLNVTMLTYPKNMEGSITILGEKGTVRIGGVAVNEIRLEDAEIADASYQTTSVYGFGHPLYYDNVIKTLRGEAEPETDGREGLKSLELLIAMYLSSRDAKRVALPLEY